MRHKLQVTFGILAIVVLIMVAFVGTALAQGTGDRQQIRDRLQTCTPDAQRDRLQTQERLYTGASLAEDPLRARDRLMLCTPDGTCVPQSGDQLQSRDRLQLYAAGSGDQLQTQTRERLRACTPEPQGDQVQIRTRDQAKTGSSTAQRSQSRARAR